MQAYLERGRELTDNVVQDEHVHGKKVTVLMFKLVVGHAAAGLGHDGSGAVAGTVVTHGGITDGHS